MRERIPTPDELEALERIDAPESFIGRRRNPALINKNGPVDLHVEGDVPEIAAGTPLSLSTPPPADATKKPEGTVYVPPKKSAGKKRGRPKGSGRVIQTKAQASTIKLPIAASMAQANTIAHIPMDIMKIAKTKGCAAFDVSARVDLDLLLDWLFTKGVLIFPEDSTSEERKDMPLTKRGELADVLTKEFKLDVQMGKYIERSLVTGMSSKVTGLLFNLIDRQFELELPPALKGLDEAAIKQRLIQTAAQLKNAFRQGLTQLPETNKQK